MATPGIATIDELAGFLGIDPAATSKAMPVTKHDGTVVLALVRGDDRLEEAKLAAALGSAFRQSTEEEIRAAFGADPGSLGPVGFAGEIVADDDAPRGAVRRRREPHRLAPPRRRVRSRLHRAARGHPVAGRGRHLPYLRRPRSRFQTAIEVGHIFKLGTTYSAPLGATFLDEQGVEKPVLMGCYGIGPGRIMAAAVEQQHDEHGIVWPRPLAPYDVHVLALHGAADEVLQPAVEVAEDLAAGGLEVLLDDRAQRPGEKFADADLLGVPLRVTVGKKTLEDDAVDLRIRATGADERIPRANLRRRIEEL